jgi:diphosphomevalonate decarboxylase
MSFQTAWRSPSNIALVKYWGKTSPQLPTNPSISMTLDACRTETAVEIVPGSGKIRVWVDGVETPSFVPKIAGFFKAIAERHPWTAHLDWSIRTHNTFPHSSGIASSASGLSALALCVVSLAKEFQERIPAKDFFREASVLARLGSGSASRSVYGGWVVWGRTPSVPGSNQEWAHPYPHAIDPVFADFRDTVLLVDVGQKAVSSTVGHGLMNNHPFAEARFEMAHRNMESLQPLLASGNVGGFLDLAEREALMLHGLMMASNPPFVLMKPATLSILEKIQSARREGLEVGFTLDAGANVHVLYPQRAEQSVHAFVNDSLSVHCKDGAFIHDRVGAGPTLITEPTPL